MDLWLLRHAEAEDGAASGRDEDRDLTPEGHGQANSVARGLAELGPGISLILTSPYRRARHTAEAVAEALGLAARVRQSRALEPGSDPQAVLSELEGCTEDSVLIVGHAPLLGQLLGRLVTGDPDREIPLKKAGVASIVIEGRGASGRLQAFLPLRVLERLGQTPSARGVL